MVKHLIKIDFRQIKIYFCELRKKKRGVQCCNTGGLCNQQSLQYLHGLLDRLPYIHIYIYKEYTFISYGGTGGNEDQLTMFINKLGIILLTIVALSCLLVTKVPPKSMSAHLRAPNDVVNP
jgi:hypothetical protein